MVERVDRVERGERERGERGEKDVRVNSSVKINNFNTFIKKCHFFTKQKYFWNYLHFNGREKVYQ